MLQYLLKVAFQNINQILLKRSSLKSCHGSFLPPLKSDAMVPERLCDQPCLHNLFSFHL